MCSCSERGQQAGQKAIPKTSLSLPICHTQLVMTIANIFWPKLFVLNALMKISTARQEDLQ